MNIRYWLVMLLTLALLGCVASDSSVELNNEPQVAEWGNRTCPVMRGVAVDANCYAIFEGKKLYFSSSSSRTEFMQNPEAYRAELLSSSGK